MSYYLVDYENVKSDGFKGIDLLTKDDEVYVFYSDNSKTITFEMMEKINKSSATILYQKVETGHKNALDFQLVSYLGYMIGEKGMDKQYCIVTKDMGYNCLVSFWNKENVCVSIVPNVHPINTAPADPALINSDSVEEEVRKIIANYKTKQGINNALVKKYGTTRGGEIYKSIKSMIKDKKGR